MLQYRQLASKADASDFLGRFREIVSDPLNLLIERDARSGLVEGDLVYLHNGNQVAFRGPLAYYDGFSDILIINRGVHEPLEEYAFQQLMKIIPDRPSMIELGAYWGHYSMWLKRARPLATTILVEPEEANLIVGRSNFARNGYQGEFIQAFVGSGHFGIDSFLDERKKSHLDILHSDIQGFEIEMLSGASQTLKAKKIDFVFISTHSQDGHDVVLSKLRAHGYRIEIASDFENETTSYDGLVFASSPDVLPVFSHFQNFGRQQIATAHSAKLIQVVSERLAEDGSTVATKLVS
jgi:Methyltransferase FkbM domain